MSASGDIVAAATEQDRGQLQAILATVIDCLPFEFFAVGLDGRYFLQNAVLREHYGDAIGKRPEDYAPNEATRHVWIENNRRAMAGERVEGEVEAWIEGRLYHFYNIIAPIRDARGVQGFLGVNVDITDRKQAEDALKQAHDELERRVVERTAALQAANERLLESEERYRRLLEACPDAVVMADLEGRVLFASRRTWELLRLPDDHELVGHNVFDYVVPSDRARLAANLFDVVQRGVRRNTEYTALCADGGTVPTEASSAVIRDAAGQPRAATAVIRDISQRKEEQRRLKHMLRASDHERQLIAYDIHDGLAQQLVGAIMQFDAYDRDKTSQPEVAADAFRAGMTVLRQSHSEARRLISGVRPPILDESGVAAAIAHLVNDPNVTRGVRIISRSDVAFTRLPAILENAIYRIVQEGLTNACKHSQSNAVRISLTQRGDRVRIEIRDWGIGFDTKVTHRNRYGLPGIRERARVLGGRCRIQSTPGTGTAIVVELPLVARAAEE